MTNVDSEGVVTLTSDQFQLAACQAVAFTPDDDLPVSAIVRDLLPRWSQSFDAEPVLLPSGPGMPRDIPRMLLQSLDSTWRCELSSGRASFHWNRTTDAPAISQEIFARLVQFIVEFTGATRRRVGRLAALVTRVAPQEAPGVFLARHFCQERWLEKPFNRPESFELHAHKQFSLGGLTVNSWVRNKTGVLAMGPKPPKPIVIVEQDVNSLDEQAPERSFDAQAITQFFDRAVAEFDVILRLYYPGVNK